MGGSTPEGVVALFGGIVLVGLLCIFTTVSVHGRAVGLGVALIVTGGLGVAFFLTVFDGMPVPWKLAAWGLANLVMFGIAFGMAGARHRARMRSIGR